MACVSPIGTLCFDRSFMNGRSKADKVSARVGSARSAPPTSDMSERFPSDAFDRWLNEKLVQLYDPVVDEPIPDRILGLIEAHRRGEKS